MAVRSSVGTEANEVLNSLDNRIKSLPREQRGYNKRGNRPSVGHLPRPSTYTIQDGAADSTNHGNDRLREENSNDSRNLMSEIGPRRKNLKKAAGPPVVQSIPNFSRILSAKTSI